MTTDFTYRMVNVDSYFDRVLYINRASDELRNMSMLAQFNQWNITNFERVEAVELSELPDPLEYRNFIKHDIKYRLGSLSCRASHLKCVRLAVKMKWQRILILEDDAVFLQDPSELLTRNQAILNDWDVLYFGGLVEPFFRNQIVCAHAYALKSSVYLDIIEMGAKSGMEIDNFYAKVLQHMSYNHNQSGKYNIRILLPFNQVVQDKSFLSNIQN
jgi:GR25 family glycosyltransferase involved in LPS biosynthesis